MTTAEWSGEAIAESFRAEIRARFEAHNAAFRASEAGDLERALQTHPQFRGEPGFEVRDSSQWEIYRASEIRIDRNTVTVILPTGIAITADLVCMFDHTAVAWSRPFISATIVNGEARPTIEIVLVATWTDDMDAEERASRERARAAADRRAAVEDLRYLDGSDCYGWNAALDRMLDLLGRIGPAK